ncbi:MAG: hypothetical protein H6733_11335 [Alphaproteobacteria bacterium]|nr:hypothetical protein [Alphaproteobacteria bacterium]
MRVLLAHARRGGASVEEAEDLVQQTLELTLRDPAWYDPDRGALVSLLQVVLRRRQIDRHRTGQRHAAAAPRLAVVHADDARPDAVAWRAGARARRHEVLALLDPETRTVFEVWVQQAQGTLTGAEAAARLGLTVAGFEAAKKRVRRRVHTALDTLGYASTDLYDGEGP